MNADSGRTTPWWQPVIFAAMAGGMGWGIRGQYGHETGAMIAGLLVTLTLVVLLCPRGPSLPVVRAVAIGTVAMGFGGSMTYGQTIGLTHDGALTGNWDALRWGMLGLSIKGGIWIGFAGVFFGMGLGGVSYRPRQMLALMLAMLGAYYIGLSLLNGPFDPANERLPAVYFSDDWRWEPDGDLRPRPENWGGLLFALAAVITYVGAWRKDRLARNLGLWGLLGGVIGFPLGQSLQAFHAWNPEAFESGIWTRLDPNMNWWNMMEITFGATMGAALGLGLWLNRKKIQPEVDAEPMPVLVEGLLLAVHVALLSAVAFMSVRAVDAVYDLGLIMGIIPMVALAGSRYWPYLMVLPVTLLPIAGKTLRQLGYREEAISLPVGWFVYFAVPLLIATGAAFWFLRRGRAGQTGLEFARGALVLSVWMYFLLNFAFFRFPWPWADWTGRTPSGIIFTVCAVALTGMVVVKSRQATSA